MLIWLVACNRWSDEDRALAFRALTQLSHDAAAATIAATPTADGETSWAFEEEYAPGATVDLQVFSERGFVDVTTVRGEGFLHLDGAEVDGIVFAGDPELQMEHGTDASDERFSLQVRLAGEVALSGELKEKHLPVSYRWTVEMLGRQYSWTAIGEIDGRDVSGYAEPAIEGALWDNPCDEPPFEPVLTAVSLVCDGTSAARFEAVVDATTIDSVCVYYEAGETAAFCSATHAHADGQCAWSDLDFCDLDGRTFQIEVRSDGDEVPDEGPFAGGELVDCVVFGANPTAYGCGCRTLTSWADEITCE